MIIDLNPQIIERLKNEYQFKERGEHLREGTCPSCGKKTLWTWIAKPGMVQCNRTNNCSWFSTSKDLFPDLFEKINQKYPATEANPNQTADVYLSLIRGFDVSKLQGWYSQAKYWHPRADKGSATVRFYLDDAKTVYWERLIEDVVITSKDGDRETRNKNFKGAFRGLWWQPPSLTIEKNDEIYLCEGILDAIALTLNGLKAVAIMSSGTFPEESIKPYLGLGIKWVLALDNDATGRRCARKHAKTLRAMKETVAAAISSDTEDKADWNDLHKQDQLTKADIKQYRYYGALELSEKHVHKALTIWKHNTKKSFFCYTFNNSTYSCLVDIGEFTKRFGEPFELVPDEWVDCELEAFLGSSKIKEIATFKMDFLYFQQPDNGEEGQYFFRFNFSNAAKEVQLPFSGKTFGGAGDFKKAVMQKTPSALFTGSTKELDFLYQQWMGRIPKIVKTLDYVGYDRDTGAYVYADYAVQNGAILKLNKESFFQLRQGGIKATVDIKQKLNTHVNTAWINDYQTAFGIGGLVSLAWWFGCLFVEQVRHKYRSYPFFEVIGEAGSGKSDMVDFLWKLLGREGESFNPNTSTLAGRTRKMAEVSNLPVVFNETDNEKVAEDRHAKMFNWDEQKDLFDGEFGRVTGVKSQDNSTKKPTFKAGLMIVQNIPVVASEAIMSRICHLQFDRSHHSLEGKFASDRLNLLAVQEVSGFLLHSAIKAEAVMAEFSKHFNRHRKTLQGNPKIKLQRIVENHAKIMAFADCLTLVLPLPGHLVNQIHAQVITMAEQRQESLNQDHAVVQRFWEAVDVITSFDYDLDGKRNYQDDLNHSRSPDKYIAINLVTFAKRLSAMQLDTQFRIDVMELKRHLPTSRKHKFIGNKPVDSRIESRIVRCWVFER